MVRVNRILKWKVYPILQKCKSDEEVATELNFLCAKDMKSGSIEKCHGISQDRKHSLINKVNGIIPFNRMDSEVIRHSLLKISINA